MSKYTPRNPMWPDWYNGKKIDEVTFCRELLHNHPMKCIDGTFQESRLFCRNRLPVAYNPKAAKPDEVLSVK